MIARLTAKLIILFAFLLMVSGSAFAQTKNLVPPTPFTDFENPKLTESNEVSQVFSLHFPSAVVSLYPENNRVAVHIYLPTDRTEPTPVVLLLHFWGAVDLNVEERMAAQLNRRKIAAIVLELPYHLSRTPKGFRSGELAIQPNIPSLISMTEQSLQDVYRVLDWVQTRPDLDPKRVGIAGSSLGAIVAVLASALDSRITHQVFLLGGIDIANIIWNSSLLVRQRETMRRQGYSQNKVRTELAEIEPAQFVERSKSKPTLIVSAKFDTVIPPGSVAALKAAFPGASLAEMETGHYASFLLQRTLRNAAIEFFASEFFGSRRIPLTRTLKAPTIRFGTIYDNSTGLQVAAGVDIWRSKSKQMLIFSGLMSPKGPKLFLGYQFSQGFSLGIMGDRKRASPGMFWSFVL